MELADVVALADAGIELLGEGHVGVRWDGALAVVVVAVVDGRCGRAEGSEDIARLVKVARLRAAQARAWPAPELPVPHETVAELGHDVLEAVANTRGLRAAQCYAPPIEQLAVPSPRKVLTPEVAGPEVVAEALAKLRPAFGVRLALGEAPPALAPAITLLDDPSVGQVKAFDVEGVRRKKVTLAQQGQFVAGVHDSSSPEPSTGHATRELTLAPRADNLVMEAGDADLGAGTLTTVDLAEVIEVGAERTLVPLRGGGTALVPSVRVRS